MNKILQMNNVSRIVYLHLQSASVKCMSSSTLHVAEVHNEVDCVIYFSCVSPKDLQDIWGSATY